jgi:type II secretory pathway component PulF
MVQMIGVGEETGQLDAMLLRVAAMQERIAHGHARTLISLLAPALILIVGALVGFIVIALLLPIFQMSQSIPR